MTHNVAAQIILSIVPLVGIICGAIVLFFFLRWYFLCKRELIKAGGYQIPQRQYVQSLSLLLGLLSTMIGIPTSILFYTIDGISYGLLGGLVPLFSGLALLVFYSLSLKNGK